MTHPGVSEIVKKFKQYDSNIHGVYEDFLFIEHYYPILHKLIKKEEISLMQFESAYSDYKTPFKKDNVFGVIDRMTKKSNPIRSFIEVVTLTENFLQHITYRVYRDFPFKLQTKMEADTQQQKLLNLIISSIDREEMINKIAEEKIRGIFYGNPVDFFEKDKAKIGIGTYIKENYKKALDEYAEFIARRNLLIHNNGRVDNKYKREIKSTTYDIGDRPLIDKEYIRNSIKVLRTLSLIATKLVLEKTYVSSTRPKFEDYIKKFDKEYKNK